MKNESLNNRYAAISRAYALFSQFFLAEGIPDLIPALKQIYIEVANPDDSDYGEILAAFDTPDELMADLQDLYANVFPYESCYFNSPVMIGGPRVEGVCSFYEQAGFAFFAGHDSADHLGVELGFLSQLTHEYGILYENAPAPNNQQLPILEAYIALFIDGHLNCWLPLFRMAVSRLPYRYLSWLVNLTSQMVNDQRAGMVAPYPDDFSPRLVEICVDDPNPTEKERQDLEALKPNVPLQRMIRALLTPSKSGLFISRWQIGTWAKKLDVVLSGDARFQMLPHLFAGAFHEQKMARLQEIVEAEVADWRNYYQTEGITSPVCLAWQSKLDKFALTLSEAETFTV